MDGRLTQEGCRDRRPCAFARHARARPQRGFVPSLTSAPRTVPGPRWGKQSLQEREGMRDVWGGFEHPRWEYRDALTKPEVRHGVRPRVLETLLGHVIRM